MVGFALEEAAVLEERAAAKMKRKQVDAIVANPLQTMDAADIQPVWMTAEGRPESGGRMSKAAFAGWLLDRVEALNAPPVPG